MPENVGFITELIADYCYKCLGHTVSRVSWCEFVHVSVLKLLEECALVNSCYCVSW